MSQSIAVHDKTFERYLEEEEVQSLVEELARELEAELRGEVPLFIGVLNGVVMFFADFIRYYRAACEISFVRLRSYEGTQSSSEVKTLLDVEEDLSGRTVVILEDIVDTGHTLQRLYGLLACRGAKSVRVIALFLKPDRFRGALPIHRVGKEIPDKFIIGYGLDYNGLGRNLSTIYQLK